MYLDRSKSNEAAHVAEELFQDEAYELERNCMVVQDTVEQGVFTLDQALKGYKVSMSDYTDFLARKGTNDITDKVQGQSAQVTHTVLLEVVAKMVLENFNPGDFSRVLNNARRIKKQTEAAYQTKEILNTRTKA